MFTDARSPLDLDKEPRKMDKVRVGHWMDGQNDEAQPGSEGSRQEPVCFARGSVPPPGVVNSMPDRD